LSASDNVERDERYTWNSADQLQIVEEGDGDTIDLTKLFGEDDEGPTIDGEQT
jgi:hypothetical protein